MIPRRTPIMGNGSRKMPANTRQNRGAIARNERVARAGFATFDVSERDSPRNRSPARSRFILSTKKKNLRARRRGHVLRSGGKPPSGALRRQRLVEAGELGSRLGH